MLIELSGRGYYGRVAIGQIHELALSEAEPVQKQIILG